MITGAYYPASVAPFVARVDQVDIVYAADMNTAYAEIDAIETVLGLSPSGAAATVSQRIANLESALAVIQGYFSGGSLPESGVTGLVTALGAINSEIEGFTLTLTPPVQGALLVGDNAEIGYVPVDPGSSGDVLSVVPSAPYGVNWTQNPLGLPLDLTGATHPTRYVGATAGGPPTTGSFNVGDYAVDPVANCIWIYTGVTSGSNPFGWGQISAGWVQSGIGVSPFGFADISGVIQSGSPGFPITAQFGNFGFFIREDSSHYALNCNGTGVTAGSGVITVELNNAFPNNIIAPFVMMSAQSGEQSGSTLISATNDSFEIAVWNSSGLCSDVPVSGSFFVLGY